MNYYPHHISDFNNATRHLTRIERSIYRDLIELYYDTESALTRDVDKLARRILAVSDEERTSMVTVLEEFFTETDQGWFHDRCDEEILKYRDKAVKAAKAGKASAAKRTNNETTTNDEQTLNGRSTDVQPTNNQEPRTNISKPNGLDDVHSEKKSTATSEVDTFFSEFWSAYPLKKNKPDALKAWKRIKADAELTDKIIFSIINHSQTRQWRENNGKYIPLPATFLNRQAWENELTPADFAQDAPVETFRERDERLARERVAAFAPGVAAKPPVIETGIVIDAEPVLRRIGA